MDQTAASPAKQSAVVLVFNDRGELALQLRAAHDKSFPLHWDFSAGGGVKPGEDTKTAAARELKEELGVDAAVAYVTAEHCDYLRWDSSLITNVDVFVYKSRHNGPFAPDPKEVERAQFFSLPDIKKMIGSGVKFQPEFVVMWNKGIISKIASD